MKPILMMMIAASVAIMGLFVMASEADARCGRRGGGIFRFVTAPARLIGRRTEARRSNRHARRSSRHAGMNDFRTIERIAEATETVAGPDLASN